MYPFKILDSVNFDNICTIYRMVYVYVKILITLIFPMLMLGIIKKKHAPMSKTQNRNWARGLTVHAERPEFNILVKTKYSVWYSCEDLCMQRGRIGEGAWK